LIKGRKILVTGGAGFIGSHLVRELLPYNKVVVLDDFSSGKLKNLPQDPNLTIAKGSVLDSSKVNYHVHGADYIFHLAADVGNIKSLENPIYNMGVNIEGTLNILEAARHSGHLKKMVFSSSSAVYGDPGELPITESCLPDPDSPYAVSKLAAERYCISYNRMFGLPTIALRYFNVYGPRQGHSEYANAIPVFFKHVLGETEVTVFGDGEQTRDFVYVTDVVNANILAAENPVVGIFNIATGLSITVNHLIGWIEQITNHPLGLTPRTYVPIRKGEVLISQASITDATNIIGYEPKVSLGKGLEYYYNDFKR